MTGSAQTIIVPVSDLDKAKAVYAALLGVTPVVDEPYYVQYELDGQRIGLDPNGHKKGMTGTVPYWEVTDVKAAIASLVEAGAEVLQDATDVGGGMLVAMVKDADGNIIGISQ
ncbi:putative enzyme related to lactoylglutathione lyase [Allocatelliglobosispora scoriae]|uniref:Putative enzyme related to lactoylglutathione lyase n=1 Tax=Allocatelliglobosispora scoriae TaxID=643052 RepID=A0A841BJ61_9ACTN|nr:VOC family protein [Allocatelliglobosispora scoriae]MBB5867236.1 putative enzyme related to lactoylglutathione lyase [Allocatelliglobosispora scoriae]